MTHIPESANLSIDRTKACGIYCYAGGDEMNPCELTASITAVANMLAGKLTVDELSLLGAVLTQLGDTLATIATQKSICEEKAECI